MAVAPMTMSIVDFDQMVRTAVQKTVSKFPDFNPGQVVPTFHPDLGLWGYILKHDVIPTLSVERVGEFTASLDSNLGALGKAATIIGPNGMTVGFFSTQAISTQAK